MARPFKNRRVCFVPGVTYFKPAGVPLRMLAENRLSIEEIEAIRLRDLEHLEQAECAERMNISRPTFQRVLASARLKIADSLAEGKALRIEGGNYEVAERDVPDTEGHEKSGSGVRKHMEEQLKIAAVTDDGKTISQHFGMATQYAVVSAEGGKVTGKEFRPKIGHGQMGGGGHHEPGPQGEPHGYGAHADRTHAAMSSNITDCSVLLARGMGRGAFDSLKRQNIEAIITDVEDIDEAVRRYLDGKLPNLMDRLH